MDDERWEPGMPVLDRQAVPERAPAVAGSLPGVASGPAAATSGRATGRATAASGRGSGHGSPAAAVAPAGPFGATPVPESLRGQAPRSVPETRPTPLQKHYVLLSAPALVLGAIAITALELGAGFDSPVVRICVLLATPLLLLTTADATLRIWRSAWAWMPVDRGRGLFRLAWVLAALVFLVLIVVAVILVLGA